MEKVTHTRPNTIWLFDYTSLESMDVCQDKIVCLSERDINIIWQAIKDIDRFRSRVYTDKSGDIYTKADLEQFENFQFWVSDLNVHLGDYDVCNEILERIAVALEQQRGGCGCGSGSSGSGSTAAPPIDFDEGEGDIAGHPGSFPSYNAYKTYKCNKAYQIVNNLANDFASLSNILPSGQTVLALAGLLVKALLTPIPFDDLLALAALILFQPFQYTFLAETSYQIFNGVDDEGDPDDYYYFGLVCALYKAANATDAYSALRLYMVNKVIAQRPWIDAEKEYVVSFLDTIFHIDAVNQLFDNIPTPFSGQDCTMCEGEPWYICSFGTVKNIAYATVIIEAAQAGDGAWIVALGVDDPVQEWNTYLDEGTQTTPDSVPEFMTAWGSVAGHGASCTEGGAGNTWDDVIDEPRVGTFSGVNSVCWRSNDPFTMVIQSLSI